MNRPAEFDKKTIILGVVIDDQPLDFVLEKIEQFLCSAGQRPIFTPNPEICLKAEKDESYRYILNTASISLPDGFGLKLGAKILGETLENRVAGSDLTRKLLEKYNNREIKVYIILRADSLSTENDLKKLFKQRYPNIEMRCSSLDIKNYDACDDILNSINSFEPQMIFVCLGAPTQEIWIHKYLKLIPSVKVALGIGGSFDFLTEKIKRAPQFMRDLGMEWFYRLYQEPRRLGRIKNATADFLLVCHRWKKRIEDEFRENVVGVIRNKQGRFLIQKNPRFKNHWQFPQGGVDKNEKATEAVVREVSEEIGAPEKLFKVVKQIPENHVYEWPEYAKRLKGYKGQAQTAFLLDFLGKGSEFELKGSREAEEIKWVNKNDLLKFIHPARQEFARKIIKYL